MNDADLQDLADRENEEYYNTLDLENLEAEVAKLKEALLLCNELLKKTSSKYDGSALEQKVAELLVDYQVPE